MSSKAPAAQSVETAVRFGFPAAIAAAVAVCFLPVLNNRFVNWDDGAYFTANPAYRGLSLSHLRWMFTTMYMSHYQPLSWLTHGMVYTMCGMNPVGYHLGNLVLHIANVVLFYVLVVQLLRSVWDRNVPHSEPALRTAAAIGALFFGIHPLRVEAVAWAPERQEVLCAFFLLLSVIAYLRMDTAGRAGHGWWTWYLVSVGCFALSLLSKAAGVMLPLGLLILDVYPLRRRDTRGRLALEPLLVEKLPYVALALGAAALVWVAKQEHAMVTLDTHGIPARAVQALYGLTFYLWKTVAPFHLSPLYPLNPQVNLFGPRYVAGAVATIVITTGLVLLRRRQPWALAAWAWYAVMVAPTLGLVQAGPQIAADRYTYVSCLPWAVLVAAASYRVSRAWAAHPPERPIRLATGVTLATALGTLAVSTYAQTAVWRDSLTLWNHVLALEPASHVAYTSRAHARDANGDSQGALADYDTALRLNPSFVDALGSRGKVRYARGDLNGSLADLDAALRLDPSNAIFYSNRGNTRQASGDLAGALADFAQAVRLEPQFADPYYNRANLRRTQGDLKGAIADYDMVIALSPQHADAYMNRGNARQASGDLAGAVSDFTSAIRLAPSDASGYFNRGNARKASGDLGGAIADYSEAIRLNPQYASAYNNRGTARNATGDVEAALADFDAAVRLNPRYVKAYTNRGVARRARGDAAGALADYMQAVALTPANDPGRAALERNVATLRQQLAEAENTP